MVGSALLHLITVYFDMCNFDTHYLSCILEKVPTLIMVVYIKKLIFTIM